MKVRESLLLVLMKILMTWITFLEKHLFIFLIFGRARTEGEQRPAENGELHEGNTANSASVGGLPDAG